MYKVACTQTWKTMFYYFAQNSHIIIIWPKKAICTKSFVEKLKKSLLLKCWLVNHATCCDRPPFDMTSFCRRIRSASFRQQIGGISFANRLPFITISLIIGLRKLKSTNISTIVTFWRVSMRLNVN